MNQSPTSPKKECWAVYSADAGWDDYYLHSVHSEKESAVKMSEDLSGHADEFGDTSHAYVSQVPFYE